MKPLRRKPSQQRSRETVDVVFEAAIYQYFPNKETLLSSLIAHYLRRRFDAIMAMIRAVQGEERATQTVAPLEEVMRRLVHGTIRLKQQGLPLEFALISWFSSRACPVRR